MNFFPESGYDVALRIIAGYGLPIKERNAQGEPASSSQSRNLMSSSSQEFQLLPRFTTPNGPSLVPNSTLNSNNRFDQSSASSVVSRNHSFVQTHSTSPLTFGSDIPSIFAGPQPRIHTSNGRLENHASSASGYGPYEARLEPTRHPQYALTKPTHSVRVGEVAIESARPCTAPVSLNSLSTGTLSQLLPPKRELPFVKLAHKPAPQDVCQSTIFADVSGRDQSNGGGKEMVNENAQSENKKLTPKKKAVPNGKATPRKRTTARKMATPTRTPTPCWAATSNRKVTPRKKAAPTKRATPKKKAAPKPKGPAKSRNLSTAANRKEIALDIAQSTFPERPLDLNATPSTDRLVKPNRLVDKPPGTPYNRLVGLDLVELHHPNSGRSHDTISQHFSNLEGLSTRTKPSDSPMINTEWVNKVNEFLRMHNGLFDQVIELTNKQTEISDKISELIDKHAELLDQVKEVTHKHTGALRRITKITNDHNELFDQVNELNSKHTKLFNHVNEITYEHNEEHNELFDKLNQLMKADQGGKAFPLSLSSGNDCPPVTNATLTKPWKRRMAAEYGITPGNRVSKKRYIERLMPPPPLGFGAALSPVPGWDERRRRFVAEFGL